MPPHHAPRLRSPRRRPTVRTPDSQSAQFSAELGLHTSCSPRTFSRHSTEASPAPARRDSPLVAWLWLPLRVSLIWLAWRAADREWRRGMGDCRCDCVEWRPRSGDRRCGREGARERTHNSHGHSGSKPPAPALAKTGTQRPPQVEGAGTVGGLGAVEGIPASDFPKPIGAWLRSP